MASPISYIVEGLLRISLLNIENWISKHWDISPGDSRLWGTPWSSSPEWVTEGGARIPITDHETASHVGDDSQDDNGTPGNGSERSSEGWDSREADTLSATQCLPGCRGEEEQTAKLIIYTERKTETRSGGSLHRIFWKRKNHAKGAVFLSVNDQPIVCCSCYFCTYQHIDRCVFLCSKSGVIFEVFILSKTMNAEKVQTYY